MDYFDSCNTGWQDEDERQPLGLWILRGREAVQVRDVSEWSAWIEQQGGARSVGRDVVGSVEVSTVFMGLNHSFDGAGPPLLFETMIFGAHDELPEHYQVRYSTWDEAEMGHAVIVAWVEAATALPPCGFAARARSRVRQAVGWLTRRLRR